MRSINKGALKNVAKLTGKYLCQSIFFNKLQASACNFIKKETLVQVFSYEFCEFFKTFSLLNTSQRMLLKDPSMILFDMALVLLLLLVNIINPSVCSFCC